MGISFTPEAAVAGAIGLIALAIASSPLTTGAGDHPIPVVDLKITGVAEDRAVVPSTVAIAPLVPAYAARSEGNPFVLRDVTVQRTTKIPFPPPPPVTPPEPAILPLPLEAQP
jgi:hypothetical protein